MMVHIIQLEFWVVVLEYFVWHFKLFYLLWFSRISIYNRRLTMRVVCEKGRPNSWRPLNTLNRCWRPPKTSSPQMPGCCRIWQSCSGGKLKKFSSVNCEWDRGYFENTIIIFGEKKFHIFRNYFAVLKMEIKFLVKPRYQCPVCNGSMNGL